MAIEARQWNSPQCPDNQPLVPACRKWQIDTCMKGWESWMSQTREQYLDWCIAMYGRSCGTRCYAEQPEWPWPVDENTPWEVPATGCPPEGPEYQDCYDVGVEWCLSSSYWERTSCKGDCPKFCHEWMDKACRRACNV